ncbi:hypothetical protein [Streptomyces sp. NPDC005046]
MLALGGVTAPWSATLRPEFRLRESGVPYAVEAETAAQTLGVGEEADVDVDGGLGYSAALDLELVAVEGIFPVRDEFFDQLGVGAVERDVSQPVVERLGHEQRW